MTKDGVSWDSQRKVICGRVGRFLEYFTEHSVQGQGGRGGERSLGLWVRSSIQTPSPRPQINDFPPFVSGASSTHTRFRVTDDTLCWKRAAVMGAFSLKMSFLGAQVEENGSVRLPASDCIVHSPERLSHRFESCGNAQNDGNGLEHSVLVAMRS